MLINIVEVFKKKQGKGKSKFEEVLASSWGMQGRRVDDRRTKVATIAMGMF